MKAPHLALYRFAPRSPLPLGLSLTHLCLPPQQVKTIVAVLLTAFDLAIVDPPGAAPVTPAGAAKAVFDTREPHGPGRNGARAGLGIFSPQNEVKIAVTRRR